MEVDAIVVPKFQNGQLSMLSRRCGNGMYNGLGQHKPKPSDFHVRYECV